MTPVTDLPPAFAAFDKMGGALGFAVFEQADGTEDEALTAIRMAMRGCHGFEAGRLRELGYRFLKRQAFLGDWYDDDRRLLVKRGSWSLADGREMENPPLRSVDRLKIVSGSSRIPDVGCGGQFAYAFSQPPYSLNARPSEVQNVFDAIIDSVMPPDHRASIRDWSHPALPEVSDYFDAGAEWWGVFLFSIYVPDLRRLTIIAGSTTD